MERSVLQLVSVDRVTCLTRGPLILPAPAPYPSFSDSFMKSRFTNLFLTAIPVLFAGTSIAATTSINTGSLGSGANGINSDTVTTSNPGLLGGSDRAAGYPTPSTPAALTTIPFQSGLNPASSSSFTIEFWANPASTAANPNSSPVSNRVSTNPRSGWAFFQRTDAWSFVMYSGTGTAAGWDLTGGTATVNQWSHVVATWSGSAATLYVNGVLADDTNAAGLTGIYNASTAATFGVGGITNVVGDNSPFRGGLVDEVAFYGSALSPAQILNHYNLALNNPSAYQATVLADGALLQLTNVPEPTSALLVGLGGLVLLRRRSR